MKRLFTRSFVPFVAAVIFWAVGPAQAAIITWQTPVNISGSSDVKNVGQIVQAFNVGDSGVATGQTVNGVAFTGVDVSASSNGNPPGPTYSVSFGPGGIDTIAGIETAFNGAGGGFSNGSTSLNSSPAYQAILNGATYNDNGGSTSGTLGLTLGGLTVGQTYQFEYFVNDSRGFIGRQETLQDNSGGSASSSVLYNNTGGANGPNNIGQYIIGTFVANGSTELINLASGSSAQINAFTLAAVPEPSSFCLLGLAAAGALLFGRRRRA